MGRSRSCPTHSPHPTAWHGWSYGPGPRQGWFVRHHQYWLVLCKKIDLKLGAEQLCKHQPSLCSARGGERAMRHYTAAVHCDPILGRFC